MVCAQHIENRDEFPELKSWSCHSKTIQQRVWRRLSGRSLYVGDVVRLALMKPNLLHSHFGYIGLANSNLHRMLRMPWIVSCCGADAFQGSVETSWKRYAAMFDHADRILVLGPFTKNRLEELGTSSGKSWFTRWEWTRRWSPANRG